MMSLLLILIKHNEIKTKKGALTLILSIQSCVFCLGCRRAVSCVQCSVSLDFVAGLKCVSDSKSNFGFDAGILVIVTVTLIYGTSAPTDWSL